MARFEQDREDILREATALVERVELWLPDQSAPIVAGFRHDGSASVYFDVEPVLQFNADRELRRAYDRGRLFKAVNGRLVSLRRERDKQEVSLLSHELTDEESAEFVSRLAALLRSLREALRQGTARIGRQVPQEANVARRVQDWLESLGDRLVIARQPNVS